MTTQATETGFLTYKRREKLATVLFLFPALLFITIFSYLSFLLNFFLSFFKVDWLKTFQWVGFHNYVKVLHYDLFWRSLLNVSVYVGLSVGIGLFLGLLFAVLMEQNIKGLGFYRVAFFMPMVVSAAAAAWIFRLLFSKGQVVPVVVDALTHGYQLDFLGNPKFAMSGIAILMMWGGIGYWILILTAGLRSIDPQLYESAMIDGAGFFAKTIHITMPLLRPVILFLTITGIIGAFQLYAPVALITPYGENPGGPDDSTQVPVLLIYGIAFGQRDFGYASALAVVLFILLMILTSIQVRFGKVASP